MKLTKQISFREQLSIEGEKNEYGATICHLLRERRNSSDEFVPVKNKGGVYGLPFDDKHIGALIELLADFARKNGGANV